MAPQTHQQGESGTDLSRTMRASSNTPPTETHLECRHHLVHRDSAHAFTQDLTLDAQLNISHITGSSKNIKQRAIGLSIVESR